MSYLTIPDHYLEYIPSLQSFVNSFMTFAPLFSYGSTVYSIYRNQSSIGFSIDICCTMLVSSILKIFYYINEPFEISLLRQCFVMIFIQCILLKVALKYRPLNYSTESLCEYPNLTREFVESIKLVYQSTAAQYDQIRKGLHTPKVFISMVYQLSLDFVVSCCKLVLISAFKLLTQFIKLFDVYYRRPFKFWQWEDEKKYWQFLALFVTIFGVLNMAFFKDEQFTLALGSSSLLTELLLPLPQILLLNRLKSIKGFKIILLLSWLGGDFTKISYLLYGTDNVTVIFIVLLLFQSSLNWIITFQFFYYQKLERRKDAMVYLNVDEEAIEFDHIKSTS